MLTRRYGSSPPQEPPIPQRALDEQPSAGVTLVGLISLLALSMTLSGCGSKLTAQEQVRYDELSQEFNQVRQERNQLSQKVDRAFRESGQLERSKKITGAKTISCQYRVGGQVLGPLPFKKRKGKVIRLGQGKKTRGACKSHTFKVR